MLAGMIPEMDDNNDQGIQTPLPWPPVERVNTAAYSSHPIGKQRADSANVDDIAGIGGEQPRATLQPSSIPLEEQHPPSQTFVEAIHNAFASPSAEASTTTPATVNSLDPAQIKQIVSQVLYELRSSNRINDINTYQSQHLPYSPQSPDLSSVASFPTRYTPPSPHRNNFDAKDSMDRSISPGHFPSFVGIDTEQLGNLDLNTQSRSSDAYLPHSQPRSECQSDMSERTLAAEADAGSDRSRSTRRAGHVEVGPDIANTSAPDDLDDPTILEKIWQPFFIDGSPTVRLGQFLRGIARYLIEDCEPKGSLVVTPRKMLRFFEETRASQEIYPWSIIFGGKMSSMSICTTYRRLLCQHHLVQVQHYEQPAIPGLTPVGFADFMTCLIQAHPDIEFERLSQAVKDMPISNADDVRERFPKELSRRLLPTFGEVQAEQRLISSLNHEIALLNLEHIAATMPPPPSYAPPFEYNTSVPERERTPYMRSAQASSTSDDESVSPPAVPIERQRKPYYAKEGSGKLYDSEPPRTGDNNGAYDAGKSEGNQHLNPPSSLRPRRTSGGLSRSESYKGNARSRLPNPSASEAHRKSMSHVMPPIPPPGSSHPGTTRRSSTPPLFNYARNVDAPGSSGSFPANQYPFPHQPPAPTRDALSASDPRRYSDGRPLERARTAEDGGGSGGGGERTDRSSRPLPTRNATTQPQAWYDPGYGVPGFASANPYARPPGALPDGGYGAFAPNSGKFHPPQSPYGHPPQR